MKALTDEQESIVKTLRSLAEREFKERAFEWGGDPPWENLELLADHGFLGINIDGTYGGGGLTEFEAMLTIEVVGQVCPDTAKFLYTQQMVGPLAVELLGTETAKERYLPPVMAAEDSIAVAISEPEAGSDVGSMRTRVTGTDDGYIINGEKIWVSNVPSSSAAVIWTKFPEGLGSAIIEFDWAGVDILQHYTNMGGHHQTQFTLTDVELPEENILTRGESSFKTQLKTLNWERVGSATLANAYACCALDKALTYAGDREQFGRPIGDFQGIEWKLADAAVQLEASRSLTYRVAEDALNRGGAPARKEASMTKLFSAEMVEDVVSEALQVHGANGYQQGHPLEYLYRLARGRRLAAGTDEIQRNQIATELKKDGLSQLF